MNNKRSKQLYFLAGAVLGGLTGYYMMTPKGKQLRKDIAEKSSAVAHNVSEKANQAIEKINDVANDSIQRVKSVSDSMRSSFQVDTTELNDELNNVINEGFSRIEEGVQTAKKKLQNGMA